MNSSLDANIILRYILEDIPKQSKMVEELLKDQEQIFHISDLVLTEVVFNLQCYEMPRENIVGTLLHIFSLPNIRVNRQVLDKALPFYLEHPALSFMDCMATFYAEVNGTEPLWTFDKRLANQHPSAKKLS